MTWRGRRVLLACEHCDEIFSRRTIDARRFPHSFCGHACHAASMSTGRRRAPVECAGCGVRFAQLLWVVRNQARHYCGRPCYEANVDRQALGRAAALVAKRAVPRAARFLRAQKAGLARGRSLSPERLSEIGRLGAARRLELDATRGPGKALGRQRSAFGVCWVSPVLVRIRNG